MNLAGLLERSAAACGDRPALAFGERIVATYREFDDRARRLAHGLRSKFSAQPGDRIALYCANHAAYLEAMYAAWVAGAVVVPINAKLHAREARYILDDSGAIGCWTDADHDAELRAAGVACALFDIDAVAAHRGSERRALEDRTSDDMAWLFYTSGTTGRPKGVMLSHGNLMHTTLAMVKRLGGAARSDVEGGALIGTIVYGGGPMYVADIEDALAVMGHKFVQIYGQGEAPMTITVLPKHVIADITHPRYLERLASVGYPQIGIEVSIRDTPGALLPPGEIGEVCARGPVVMRGYWNNPEATRSTIRDGWLYTGDLGVLDAEGFLTLKDRSKDVIISGGSNIYPREVEEVLLAHPGVREASVIGIPDPEWGESVVAFVVGDAVTPEDLDRLCLAHIARFKRPKRYRFLTELPKNNYGKVLKTELRKLATEFG